MGDPDTRGGDRQAEADLLAEGREFLERRCASTRFRHLYPEGPNLSLLLEQYQELERIRDVRRRAPHPRRDRRIFRRLLAHAFRRDTLDRERQLDWSLPTKPRDVRLRAPVPQVVRHALAAVDSDVRHRVKHLITGDSEYGPQFSGSAQIRTHEALSRGLKQFGAALIDAALADPASIRRLHPQYITHCESAPPLRKRHPLATLLLVKLPLGLLTAVFVLFSVVYVAAYALFNDEVLGDFVSDRLHNVLDGDLVLESIHWNPWLIFDLVSGRPHEVAVDGVYVYPAYKKEGLERESPTAYVEHLDVRLVLHEAIPWNRLGVPTFFEIPWVLHFAEVRNTGDFWFVIRDYQPEGADHYRSSLIEAFRPARPLHPPAGVKRMSYRVDDARINAPRLVIDYEERSDWGVDLAFQEVDFSLDYEGTYPEEVFEHLPLHWSVKGMDAEGELRAVGESLPVEDFELERLESGTGITELGDMTFALGGRFAASPVRATGVLRNVLKPDRLANLELTTPDLGPALSVFMPRPDPEDPDSREMIDASGVPAAISVTGPFNDPVVRVVAQGLTLDLTPESAWALDDVDVSLMLAKDRVPPMWDPHRTWIPDVGGEEDQRWILYFKTLRGSALDGDVRLHGRGQVDHVVLPSSEVDNDPLLASIYVDVEGINPGQLTPENRDLALRLRGASRGGVELHKLVVGTENDRSFSRAEVFLHDMTVDRDRGPADDRLPRRFSMDGDVIYDRVEGLDLRGLKVSVPGGTLRTEGGFQPGFEALKRTGLALRVEDGASFLRGFGLDPYFERLLVDLTVSGPLGGPSGTAGSLTLDGPEAGPLAGTTIEQARLWMDRGVLKLRSPDARMLGGKGELSVDLVLFEGGRALTDPKIRASVKLQDMDQKGLLGSPIDTVGAQLDLFIDDGDGRAVRLSKLQARGAAYARRLAIAGTDFRNAQARFAFDREGLDVETLALEYHQPVSPRHRPGTTIEVGRLDASGHVGFEADPQLDLKVNARGVPLSAFAGLAGGDLPVRGRIGDDTSLDLEGSLRRPVVNGTIELDGLSAFGVPLGRGELRLVTEDLEADPGRGLEPRRLVHVRGALGNLRDGRPVDKDIAWDVDMEVAFSEPRGRRGEVAMEAEVQVGFARLPIERLLRHPSRAQWREHVAGSIQGARAHTRVCDAEHALLSACAPEDQGTANVELRLNSLEVYARGQKFAGSPCDDARALCARNPLDAVVRDGKIVLRKPWTLRSGGKDPALLTLSGNFDVSTPAPPAPEDDSCDLQTLASNRPYVGHGGAAFIGNLDIAVLEPFLRPYGVEGVEGRIGVDLAIEGAIAAPRATGSILLDPSHAGRLRLAEEEATEERAARPSIPVELSSLSVDVKPALIGVRGQVKIYDETITFGGDEPSERTYLALAGACAGQYRLFGKGLLDGALAYGLVPDLVLASSGTMRLEELVASGNVAQLSAEPGQPLFDELRARLALGRNDTVRARLDFERLLLSSGTIEVRRCSADRPCNGQPEGMEGAIGVYLGGERGAAAEQRPGNALRVGVGDRGGADAWGWITMSPDLGQMLAADLSTRLEQVPYLKTDNSGKPELETSVSSERIRLSADEFGRMAVEGKLLVESSRWLREPSGATNLSFADPNPVPPSQLSDELLNLELDLEIETSSPFRMDLKTFDGIEAEAEIQVTGTVGTPELAGTIDIQRGEINLPLLGEPYDVVRGKVYLDRELASSFVDLAAIGKEPRRIDGQLKFVTVSLIGTLDEITVSCSTAGGGSSELDTTRGCVDVLLLGSGQVDVSGSSVRRAGGGGLFYARPLAFVGNLTKIRLNDAIEGELPRVEPYLPVVEAKVGQLGLELDLESRPEWMDWGWGNLGFGVNYLRGYPGGLLRDRRKFSLRLELLENTAIEASIGRRNYFNRVLINDPASFQSVELIQRQTIPSAR